MAGKEVDYLVTWDRPANSNDIRKRIYRSIALMHGQTDVTNEYLEENGFIRCPANNCLLIMCDWKIVEIHEFIKGFCPAGSNIYVARVKEGYPEI